MDFCSCFQIPILWAVQLLENPSFVILVEHINSFLISPLLNEDVGNRCVVPPLLFNALLRVVLVVLKPLIGFQNRRDVLLPRDDGRIRRVVVVEEGRDACQGVVVDDSFHGWSGREP